MRLSLWPQSLFGRLLAASVIAVLLAQAVALFLIAQEREHFVLQGSVREWTRRITETTLLLQPMNPAERAAAVSAMGAARDRPPPPAGARRPFLSGLARACCSESPSAHCLSCGPASPMLAADASATSAPRQ